MKNALRDLVPLAKFLKCEKHPWRTVALRKVTGKSLQLY